MKNFNVYGNFNGRVFVFEEGILKCDVEPMFLECAAIDSLSQDRGDITKVECPSPYRYGEFQEVYSFSGELSRVTTTINTYMSRISTSAFFSLFDRDCPFDLHIHFGECQNPSDFKKFDKALILEDVRATSWTTDPLISLTSADKGIVQESIDVSARRVLELVNLQYSEVATNDTVDGPFVKGLVADTRSCGGVCDNPSDGCQVQFAVTDDGYLYFTTDGGYSWTPQQIIDIVANPTSIPVDMFVVGDSIIVASDDDILHVADRSDFLLDPVNTTWDTLDVSGSIAVNALDSAYNVGALVGNAGVVALADLYGEITIVENGSVTTEDLNDVDVHEAGVILAGGNNGAVIFSLDNGEKWDIATAPTTDNVVSVLVKSQRSWLVGTETGELWCTDNSGVDWNRVSYPGWASATAPVLDLQANSTHVVYMLQNNRLLKSIDGGSSWVVEPSNTKKNLPTATMTSIAPCWDNINTLTVVGDNAGSGAVVLGSPIN